MIASLDPRDAGRSLVNLGKVLGWAGKFEEAYDTFQRALEILGPHPAVYYGLASALYSLGKPEEAARYYQATLVLAPERHGVHAELARIFDEQGKADEAIEQCRAELELDPDNYHVHVALAEILEKQGNQAAALQHLQTALQLNPQQHRAHTALGLILKQQGNYRQAIQHFSERCGWNRVTAPRRKTCDNCRREITRQEWLRPLLVDCGSGCVGSSRIAAEGRRDAVCRSRAEGRRLCPFRVLIVYPVRVGVGT